MTFIEAMRAASQNSVITRVLRPDGPSLHVNQLGQVLPETGCLDLADILDMDDWEAETSPASP